MYRHMKKKESRNIFFSLINVNLILLEITNRIQGTQFIFELSQSNELLAQV